MTPYDEAQAKSMVVLSVAFANLENMEVGGPDMEAALKAMSREELNMLINACHEVGTSAAVMLGLKTQARKE